ncbi:P-loop containing nucleoside triphosphate hydrolase protein [Spinellus fusiger]|nr:P-loop containing nucleoside triphosphate hydrolase protein [Spinellus fusiger]
MSAHLTQLIQVYTKGTQAWFEDDQDGWVSASVVSNATEGNTVKMVFVNDQDASREHMFEGSLVELDKQKGSTLPPLRNPPKMEDIDDLTDLSYLNEPSVLNTIRIRYQRQNIYTYSGIVLIAANPFARVPLYEPHVIQQYSGKRKGELEPHLFAISEDAYRCMIREKTNQTIVVSGESGAGKTVSAKYIMRYFATADDKETTGKASKSSGAGMTEVEEQILATNPVMEAFGNAKTTRNDNSSRFGKYIEIQFDTQYNIVGAKVRTYLLERSRLVFQPEIERNYHIFYQLCAGAPAEERERLGIKDWTYFNYLNQSGTGVIPGVDDIEEFELTQSSMSKIGVSSETQWHIFRILAALLHLGNMEIGGRTDATLAEDEASLQMATQLLGIPLMEFRKWIIRKQIITRSEKIVTNLNTTQAQVVRDSVAKYIYAYIFEWLVVVVNDSLSCSDPESVTAFIGVLDIYGFEHFKKNSFEQFCINYANEKLQQQFNQHVFKLEQEEYVREEIDWKFIEFADNQKCIEMIENKMGILSLLDEESRLPSGTDQGFCNKLYSTFNGPYQDYFKKPRFSNNAFTVVHYAHDVQYEAEGFLEKNKDTVPEEHLTLLQNTEFEFLSTVLQAGAMATAATAMVETQKKANNTNKKSTLGSIFKLSLINLMDTIAQTNVHYIRCIKPNEAKVAWTFEPNMVLSQLRACGVLETIRISCAGYPSRWTFADFGERYYALVHSKHWDPHTQPDIRALCSAILDTHILDKDKYQVGLSKIFFRAGQLAYMEKLRSDRWNQCATFVQKNARRFITRIKYLRMQTIVLKLQQIARQRAGVQKLVLLRQERAAVVVQKYWRGYLARQWYKKQLAFVVNLQTAVRSLVIRKRFAMIREHNAATTIQCLVRGWIVRKQYHAKRQYIISIQTCIRQRIARQQLVAIRLEARSVSHFKEVSYKLEHRVNELTRNLQHQKEEKTALKEKAVAIEVRVKAWIQQYDVLDSKAKELETIIGKSNDVDSQWEILQQERERLQQEYTISLDKIKGQDKTIALLSDQLTQQKEQVSKLRQVSQTVMESTNVPDVIALKKQITSLRAQLTNTLHQPSLTSKRSTVSRTGQKSSIDTSSDAVHELCVGEIESPKEKRWEFLEGEGFLQDMLETLVVKLAIPFDGQPKERKDIVFPAHCIGQYVSLCWQADPTEADRVLEAFCDAIQKHCLHRSEEEDEEMTSTHAFWLTNTQELISVLDTFQIDASVIIQRSSTKMITRLNLLQERIYTQLGKDTKRKLSKMVSTVVDSQLVPGFMTPDTGRTKCTMDDLTGLLSHLDRVLVCCQVDTFVAEQLLMEVFKYIGVACFNDMLSRRGFNSWKRAMQIQFNVSKLEEWCKSHQHNDCTLSLEHVSQAAKLLQLKKTTPEDINIIFDVCWILTPAQVQKLIQQYSVADYEDSIGHDVLKTVASRVNSGDSLILDSVSLEDCPLETPEPRQQSIDTYLPVFVSVQSLSLCVLFIP